MGYPPWGPIWVILWGMITKMQTIIFLKRLLEGNLANGKRKLISSRNILVKRRPLGLKIFKRIDVLKGFLDKI